MKNILISNLLLLLLKQHVAYNQQGKNQHCWQQFTLKNRQDTSEKRCDGTNSSRLLYLRTNRVYQIQDDYHIERQIISKDPLYRG
jgi:hypothetical protein